MPRTRFFLLLKPDPDYQEILNAFTYAGYLSFGELLCILLLLKAIQILDLKFCQMLKLKIARSSED